MRTRGYVDADPESPTAEEDLLAWLHQQEAMAVLVAQATVAGHQMGPAWWEFSGRSMAATLLATCTRCSAYVSVVDDYGTRIVEQDGMSDPCRGGAA
jgi:hypothetical protein